MTKGRIVIIPFFHGKITADGRLVESDGDSFGQMNLSPNDPELFFSASILWVAHQPLFQNVVDTDLVRVTAEYSDDLAAYDPAQDADLYDRFLSEDAESPPTEPHKIWIDQCEAAENIEDEFGTQKALDYLVGEKFLNFLEAAETDADFRSEIPAFVERTETIFEPWQLAQYLETARETEPFDSRVYEDDEEAEMERQSELRRSAADLLLVERARGWLLEEEG